MIDSRHASKIVPRADGIPVAGETQPVIRKMEIPALMGIGQHGAIVLPGAQIAIARGGVGVGEI